MADGRRDKALLDALGEYVGALDEFAPGLVEGLYVVGSAALDDWQPGRSDIDIVAVTAEPATEVDASAIRAVHAVLAERLPATTIDGPYVAWGDLVVEPATGLHRPWALGGELHHDGDCAAINPVTWYVLLAAGLTVLGPPADGLEIAVDPTTRVRFALDDLDSYWRGIGEQLGTAVGRRTISATDLEWCVLGPLRQLYTATTTDVTSKSGAGRFGLTVAPAASHDVIGAGLDARRRGVDGPVEDRHVEAAADLVSWVLAAAAEAR